MVYDDGRNRTWLRSSVEVGNAVRATSALMLRQIKVAKPVENITRFVTLVSCFLDYVAPQRTRIMQRRKSITYVKSGKSHQNLPFTSGLNGPAREDAHYDGK